MTTIDTHATGDATSSGAGLASVADWLTTTDHKKIGILYLIMSFSFFAVGGISNNSTKSACNSDVATAQTAEDAYYAQNNAYTTIAILSTTAKLLRSAPSNSAYVISADAVTGAVTAVPLCSTL